MGFITVKPPFGDLFKIFVGPTTLSKSKLGGGNSSIFYFHPYLGKWANLTNIFQKPSTSKDVIADAILGEISVPNLVHLRPGVSQTSHRVIDI